jgi:hypothetical protein
MRVAHGDAIPSLQPPGSGHDGRRGTPRASSPHDHVELLGEARDRGEQFGADWTGREGRFPQLRLLIVLASAHRQAAPDAIIAAGRDTCTGVFVESGQLACLRAPSLLATLMKDPPDSPWE